MVKINTLSIAAADGMVVINGRAIVVDCSSIAATVHAVQWAGSSGEVEPLVGNDQPHPGNAKITDLKPFQAIIDAWEAAADAADNPPPPTLDQTKAAKIMALRAACSTSIFAGFVSSALGSTHVYPADFVSQFNLAASVTASLLPGLPPDWTTPFVCTPDGSNWDHVPHTVAQIQQVGVDAKATVVAAQLKFGSLAKEVNSASTTDEVSSIGW